MHSTGLKTPGIVLIVLCATSVLMLAAPKTVTGQSHVQTVETSQGVSSVCAEQYCFEFAAQLVETALAIADRHVPVTYAAPKPQPEEIVRAELQVPAALLRSLWMEGESSRTIELHVPAALLATQFTEGWVQMPHRSPAQCRPLCSLY